MRFSIERSGVRGRRQERTVRFPSMAVFRPTEKTCAAWHPRAEDEKDGIIDHCNRSNDPRNQGVIQVNDELSHWSVHLSVL